MKGVAEGLGIQALAADLGMPLALSVHADSSAAIGICRRSGIGRVRHLAVGQLWVQDHLRRGTFQLFKVRGDENPADLCTKHLARAAIDGLIEICGAVRETGRAASAPRLNVEVEPLPTKPSCGSSVLASLSPVHCSQPFLAQGRPRVVGGIPARGQFEWCGKAKCITTTLHGH